MVVHQPLHQAEVAKQYSIHVNVQGGGTEGQAGAICLDIVNAKYRPSFKQAGDLPRDPRMVEHKNYGRNKVRTRFQFSK
ncbi:unnamed protein product, partial [Discosporangium mesarthrocarpum]